MFLFVSLLTSSSSCGGATDSLIIEFKFSLGVIQCCSCARVTMISAIFIALLLSESLRGCTTNTKKSLDLLVLLPYFNSEHSLTPSWAEGDNIFPALQLARDQINDHSSVLQNFSLNLIRANTGCQHVSQTMLSFVQEARAGTRLFFVQHSAGTGNQQVRGRPGHAARLWQSCPC